MLLSLDDAHWADPASLEVIAHLVRRFRGPLLVAVAFRHAPRQVAAALEAVARVGSGVRLELQPLTKQEATELIDPRLDTATRSMIFRESGGNPFYLEQLARAQFASGPARTVSAAHARLNVIDRQLLCREDLTTVDAAMSVARENLVSNHA